MQKGRTCCNTKQAKYKNCFHTPLQLFIIDLFPPPLLHIKLRVTFTLFKADGTPVRAKMKVDLQECEDATAQPPQNPTSQGTYGHKAHVVQPGDNIDLLANKYYGNPKSWRLIADANDLDNPKDLRVGRVLEIVPV